MVIDTLNQIFEDQDSIYLHDIEEPQQVMNKEILIKSGKEMVDYERRITLHTNQTIPLHNFDDFFPIIVNKASDGGMITSVRKMMSKSMREMMCASMRKMLVSLMMQIRTCDLVVIYDVGFSHSGLLQLLNTRQVSVVHLHTVEDLLNVSWVSSRCSGYLYLLQDPSPLLHFLNTHSHSWDYHGRHVVVGVSLEQLVALTRSSKGRKTQHLLGIVKSVREEWKVYMNQLYGDPGGYGVKFVTSWRGHRFTPHVDFFPDQLSNLHGAVLTVVTFVWEPSIFYFRASNGSVLYQYGVDIEVTRLLAQALNFSVQFVEPPEGELWGSQNKDGSWTGMMGLLDTDTADMGVANLYVSISRVGILDFTAPYDSEVTCFLARREPPLARWQAIAFPFHWTTWIAIFFGLLLSGPAIFFFSTASRKFGKEIGSLRSLTGCWNYSVGIHLMKSQAHLPLLSTTKVLITSLWLYTTIITIAYSTNLTAFLLVNKPPKDIETIKDLYDSDLKVIGMGEFYKDELASASDPYLKGLTKFYEGQKSTDEAYQKVLKGRAVFLQNRAFVEFIARTKFTSSGFSRMRIMKECFAPYNIAMGLQRHSPLKVKFDEVIGWIQQSGLLRHYFLYSLRLAASTKEYKSDVDGDIDEMDDRVMDGGGGVIPLSLDHLQGCFIVLVVGSIAAAIVFLLEVTYSVVNVGSVRGTDGGQYWCL
nr:ionotropic receptor 21a-like [Cherax quadricarinatus]